jgi:predicted permease
MISRHSQGKTSSPRAVNPMGMQLTPDELGGDGWPICATCWSRRMVSPASALPIAAAENINTKAVFFIGCLQLGGLVAATPLDGPPGTMRTPQL